MNRKIVVRNILLSLLALVMLGALVYLALSTPKVKAGDRCRRVAIEVKSETGGDPLFLTPDRIADELARRGIQLQGKRLDSIDLRPISSASPSTRQPKPSSPLLPPRYRYALRRSAPCISSRNPRVRATTSLRARAPSASSLPSQPTYPSSRGM